MKKILCVIRVSTEKQETESQKSEMLTFIKSKGFKENEIEWIETAGASARKLNKKYLEMVEAIKSTILNSESIKTVALWHLNRLGRVDTVLTEFKNFFIQNKIQVYIKEPSLTLFEENGTVNASTEIVWSLFATLIKLDTEELMGKLARGRNQNRVNGKFNGGAFGALYGYDVDDNGYIVPCAEEVELINQIFNDYAKGIYSVRTLAKEYRDRGITQRDGRKITDMWVSKLLENTAYTGHRKYIVTQRENGKTTKKEFERDYPIIVDIELFDKVKAIREGKDLGIRKTKEYRNTNLAVKLLKCKECGHNYIATRDKYSCYQRTMAHRFDEKCNNSVSISINIMDNLLWFISYQKHLDYLTSANNHTIKDYEQKKAIAIEKQNESQRQLEALTDRANRIQDLYINGDLTKERYENQKAKLAADERSLNVNTQKYIDEIERYDALILELQNPTIDKFVKTGIDLFEVEKKKEIKDIVNLHIKDCYVERTEDNGRKTITIYINTKDKHTYTFKYFYTIKDKTRQLYEVQEKELVEIGTSILGEIEKRKEQD